MATLTGLKTTLKTNVNSVESQKPKTGEKSIGALWHKVSKKGVEYFTGDIEIDGKLLRIKVFRHGFKEIESHPDWKIYLREPLDKE